MTNAHPDACTRWRAFAAINAVAEEPPAQAPAPAAAAAAAAEEADPDYSSKEYWEQRYVDRVEWEWYFAYSDLKPLLDKCLKKDGSVLDVGCGDKPLVSLPLYH
jgi:hypothetical protein